MKLLFVTGTLPYPPTDGWKIRVFALLRGLAQRHSVSVVSFVRRIDDALAVERLRDHGVDLHVVRRDHRYAPSKLFQGLVGRTAFPILNYRDELYRRLPKTPETFAAAMDDLMQRLHTVAEDKDLLKQFVADVREWATLEPRPPHVVNALARAARKLADSKGPQYYQSPYWHSSNVMAWRKTRGSVDSASALKDLAVYLEEQAAQPQLEIKEKK